MKPMDLHGRKPGGQAEQVSRLVLMLLVQTMSPVNVGATS